MKERLINLNDKLFVALFVDVYKSVYGLLDMYKSVYSLLDIEYSQLDLYKSVYSTILTLCLLK